MSKFKGRTKDTKALRLRNGILAFVALLAILVLGYGTLYSTGVSTNKSKAGEDYREVENPPKVRPGSPVVVTEFFSYGCVHCRDFDPMLSDWVKKLPDGVLFERAPVSFSPIWELLGQSYLALEQLDGLDQNHHRIFSAIHDERRQFLSLDAMADFIRRTNVSRDEFLRIASSPEVRRKIASIEKRQVKLGVQSVPTLVIDDRYIINPDAGRKQTLAIARKLIKQTLAERQSADKT